MLKTCHAGDGARESMASDRSVKLNRDLDRMLVQAIERDLLVRIGWGREGDEKPKNGEIGALSLLPDESRSLLLGNLGEGAGLMNRGGTATVQGSVASMAGGWMSSGRLVVEKDAGSRVGFKMSGGSIVIHGSSEDNAGSRMSGGTLLIRGDSGSNVGSGMSGGTVIIIGSSGDNPGIGMTGGQIIICGECGSIPQGVLYERGSVNVPEDALDLISSLGIEISDGSLVLEAGDSPFADEQPSVSRGGSFSGIGIVGSGSGRIDSSVDVRIGGRMRGPREESHELILERPWVPILDGSSNIGPCIARGAPEPGDLLMVGDDALSKLEKESLNCIGVIVDLDDLPRLNDAELDSIIVSIRSRMEPGSLVLLADRVDRVEELSRRCVELDLDGILVDAASLDGAGATVALPRIGMASKKSGLTAGQRFIMIRLEGAVSADTIVISKCAGIGAVVSPNLEGGAEEVDSKIRGILREMGVASFSEVNRSNLRAIDHGTAMQTGLRLAGLERPLPTWTRRD